MASGSGDSDLKKSGEFSPLELSSEVDLALNKISFSISREGKVV
jgi:hypothetical protein